MWGGGGMPANDSLQARLRLLHYGTMFPERTKTFSRKHWYSCDGLKYVSNAGYGHEFPRSTG